MFIRKDAAAVQGDPGQLFLKDALARLTPAEKSRYDRLGDVSGFLFSGQKFTCIVIVSLKADVIIHAPNPVFCYDITTNEFAKRL